MRPLYTREVEKPGFWVPALRAVLGFGVMILLAEMLFRGFLVPLLGVRLTDTPDVRQWPGMLVLGVLFPVVMTGLALGLCRFADRRPIREMGLHVGRAGCVMLVSGVLLMAAGFGVFIGITELSGTLRWRLSAAVSWRFLLTAAVVYLGTGLWEEFFFRGYLYRTLTAYGKPTAYLVSILLFSLIHFTEEPFLVSRILNLLLVSFFLTYVYDRTTSIWPGVVLHGSWNLLSFLAVSNQVGVSPLLVHGPAGPPLRWFSTVLHVVLVALVWQVCSGRDGSALHDTVPL